MKAFIRGLCWMRRDLRLEDHAALAAATESCAQVAVVFVYDTNILDKLVDRNDRRMTFIEDSLDDLRKHLQKHGSELLLRHGDPRSEIPALMRELSSDALFANRDYEPYAKDRDQDIAVRLKSIGPPFILCKDLVIFEGLEVSKTGRDPYRVFTPYARAWRQKLNDDDVQPRTMDPRALIPADDLKRHVKHLRLTDIGFVRSPSVAAGGASAARQVLNDFRAHIETYGERRDFPADARGTSGLSVHLRFGTISIREVVAFARNLQISPGAEVWLKELIWREFYQMILDQFPHVVGHSFKPEYEHILWRGGTREFQAWCDGMTGYPLVDAAMRQLKTTGKMPNRCRMVVASFLTKDLLVDWRRGEAWFARHLLDYDLAANNGGWQWSASTGCDAQPYFRIFNPVAQSEKFDPEGEYIRHWIPALTKFPKKFVHWPHTASSLEQKMAGCRLGQDYPHPIVDHHAQRIGGNADV